MSKVLVTGGCGFIGSHIVDELLLNNYEVVIVDNLSSGNKKNINLEMVDYHECDINSLEFHNLIDKSKPDFIIHHAAQVSVAESVKNMMKDMEINIKGSLNVMQAAIRNKVSKIVFASSAAVYGEPRYLPIDTNHDTHPLSPYGVSKLTVEKYLQLAKQLYGIDYTILRYSNVYGPRQDTKGEGGVISIFIEKLVKGEKPVIFGDGEQTRDFVFVKDVAKANVSALKYGNGETLNVSSNNNISIKDLIAVMDETFQFSIFPIFMNERDGEIKHSWLCNERTKEILGVKFESELKHGLIETFEYRQSRDI
ncbi:NAD-dependent epimerase/dehydratase family protein [Bacillus sp. CGMCC 1.16607]|uniref:NAD-dependent epimerase/dehydratase family protein n=1 Tax=Bacillus sp. CGMCC 1.16607 TaxID=3351842 RepID=UPI00362D1BFC